MPGCLKILAVVVMFVLAGVVARAAQPAGVADPAAPPKKAGAKARAKAAADTPPPAEAAPVVPPPSSPVKVLSREEKVQRQFETMAREYQLRIDSPDWILRSLSVISMGRLPTEVATKSILQQMDRDREIVGRLVAWQAMLSRAPLLTAEQFAEWERGTHRLIAKDAFHGDLRIGLLEMLSATPPTRDSRAYFLDLFKKINSLDSMDLPTLVAMGHALRAWGDESLYHTLLGALDQPSTAIRAELILQASGADVPWNRTPEAAKVYAKWWKDNRATLTANPPAANGYKHLKPQFLGPPVKASEVDPEDPKWRTELELGHLELQNFDFAIAVDCSRSMRPEIERLKRDVAIMMAAFQRIAREPRMGVTLFAPGGIVKCQPLTGDLGQLGAFLTQADIMGPAGEEEWAGALQQTLTQSQWVAPGEHSRRFIVIMSDEPITQPQYERALPMAQAAGKQAFRIYGVMVHNPPGDHDNPLGVPFAHLRGGILNAKGDDAAAGAAEGKPEKLKAGKVKAMNAPAAGAGKGKGAAAGGGGGQGAKNASWQYYDTLSDATGASSIRVEVPKHAWGLGYLPQPLPKGALGKPLPPVNPVAFAPLYVGGGPTQRVLSLVLRDAINPKFADRVDPFVKILVNYCQGFAPRLAENRTWAAPDAMEPNVPGALPKVR